MELRKELLTKLKSIILGSRGNNYLEMIYNLLSYSEQDAIEYLRKFHISEDSYQIKLRLFENRFPEYIEERKYLAELYQKYLESYYPKKESVIKEDEELIRNQKIMKQLFESNYTVELFCSKYGYHLHEINLMIRKLPSTEKEQILEKLESRSNAELIETMTQVIKEICLNKEFDIIDYYQYTHLYPISFDYLLREHFNELSPLIMKKVSIFIRKYEQYEKIQISRKPEIATETIIDDRVITKEEREKIFNYLEQNNIPNYFYKEALRKYIQNEDYFNEIQKVNRKV